MPNKHPRAQYLLHFIDEETEAEGGLVTGPRDHLFPGLCSVHWPMEFVEPVPHLEDFG